MINSSCHYYNRDWALVVESHDHFLLCFLSGGRLVKLHLRRVG